MSEERLRGKSIVSGAFGTMWLDNKKIMELVDVNVKVTAERVDVQLGLSVDSKIVSLKGEGSYKIKKVYTRAATVLENWKKGNDIRVKITTKIEDPDSLGKQIERVSIDNVWYNSIDLIKITKGEITEEEYPFGFTPDDAKFEEEIK